MYEGVKKKRKKCLSLEKKKQGEGGRREGSREGEKSGRTDSSTPSVSANAQKLLNRTARHRFLSTERSLLAAQNKQQIAH